MLHNPSFSPVSEEFRISDQYLFITYKSTLTIPNNFPTYGVNLERIIMKKNLYVVCKNVIPL